MHRGQIGDATRRSRRTTEGQEAHHGGLTPQTHLERRATTRLATGTKQSCDVIKKWHYFILHTTLLVAGTDPDTS